MATNQTRAPLALNDVRDRFQPVRSHTEELAAPLSVEDQVVSSMPDVSPTKWHRGHTTWFWETFLLVPYLPGYRTYHPDFGYLFNSYYEAVGPRHNRAERGLITRPGVAEVGAYREHVDAAMGHLLTAFDALPAGTIDLIELGLHHEQQHQELLLMDIKHVLSRNPLSPTYLRMQATGPEAPAPLGWVEPPSGMVELGHAGGGFAFDNELPRHPVLVAPYRIADRLTTCGDWLEFMADGGYQRPELWLSDGWATAQQNGWQAPLYWNDHDGEWTSYSLTGTEPITASTPVCHISYYEADAFARWSGARLPTEQEWESAAPPEQAKVDLNLLHPDDPVNGWYGQVWQWTASAYLPYPGFKVSDGAVGEYNGKFMVNQHVLRGSACITPPGHDRRTYRNFFPPAARWAFSGVRLARDA